MKISLILIADENLDPAKRERIYKDMRVDFSVDKDILDEVLEKGEVCKKILMAGVGVLSDLFHYLSFTIYVLSAKISWRGRALDLDCHSVNIMRRKGE